MRNGKEKMQMKKILSLILTERIRVV